MSKLTPEQLARLEAVPENRPSTTPGELLPHVRFLGDIKHLLVDPDYAYAEGILRGILETVARTEFVSEGQRRAVTNISAAPNRAGASRRIRRGRWDE